jgi:FkbM family methyltransferase
LNLWRFLKKCATDQPAALRSAKIVARTYYGRWYWRRHAEAPLAYRLPTGGVLLLEPNHSFTNCFWPDVDHYEPDVRGILGYLLKPGDTFIDCGANVGYFSVQAGALVGEKGTVVSIEANPETFLLLKRNLEANGVGVPLNCALTSQSGEVELFMPNDWDVYSSLRRGGLVQGDAIRSFKVKGRGLDDVVRELGLSSIKLVKVDVEGAELDVLGSATHLLRNLRPYFIVEYGMNTWPSFGVTSADLKKLAAEYDYSLRLFDPFEQRLIEVAEEVWQSAYVNIVLAPNA